MRFCSRGFRGNRSLSWEKPRHILKWGGLNGSFKFSGGLSDSKPWNFCLLKWLKMHLDGPSVIKIDNVDPWVKDQSYTKVSNSSTYNNPGPSEYQSTLPPIILSGDRMSDLLPGPDKTEESTEVQTLQLRPKVSQWEFTRVSAQTRASWVATSIEVIEQIQSLPDYTGFAKSVCEFQANWE